MGLANFTSDVLKAIQGRFHTSTLNATVTKPAWKESPGFFIVADNDQMIAPQIEAACAEKIGAVTYLPAKLPCYLSQKKWLR